MNRQRIGHCHLTATHLYIAVWWWPINEWFLWTVTEIKAYSCGMYQFVGCLWKIFRSPFCWGIVWKCQQSYCYILSEKPVFTTSLYCLLFQFYISCI